MNAGLTIHQRKFEKSRTFQFDTESLVYTVRDRVGERTFTVPYQVIDTRDLSKLRLKMPVFAQALFGVILLSVGALMMMAMALAKSASPFVVVAGIVIVAIVLAISNSGLLAVSFTLVPMAPAPPGANSNTLSVIDDKRRDQIVDELSKRSRERLRTLFGTVNLNGDPDKEAGRMQWLKERGAISEEEFAEQLRQLRVRSNADHGQQETRLN